MALSNYTGLKASIADFLNRDDLTAVIPDFITLAEAQINRDIRHFKMEARSSGQQDAGDEYMQTPADWIETIRLHLTGTGTTVVKDQFTGNNATVAFTLSTTPSSADNINIYISGVYQNSLDSGGVANYSVAGTTLTFVTAPPTTAANGIEVVITQ